MKCRGTNFNWQGKQLIASCLFEVITLGLFPSASWEEAASPGADAVCQKSERCCEEPACYRGDSSKLEIEQWTLPSPDPISWRTMLCSWHFSTTHKRQSRASTAVHCARCDILVPSALKCAGEETSPCIVSNDFLTAKDLWCGHNHLVANAFSPLQPLSLSSPGDCLSCGDTSMSLPH